MKNILFVDDEPVLLDGLKRSLRSMRNEWTIMFADGGEEALKALEQTPFDVIVSDMRMPKMDGAQLLNEVQRRYPHIVRIVLSGYSDKEMIFHSIRATHQFLAKPCEPEQLKMTIRRACALQNVLKNEALRALVTGMSAIPSLPAILLEIKQEAESETSSLKAIGKIIVKDMGLTAKILQLANSAFFGVRGPISTVEQAVNFLGLETVQALILVAHVFSQFSAKHLSTFQIARLWEESLETGALAREIAKVEGCTPFETEQAYTAGLLHDMGILVLAANCADQFNAILAEAAAKRGTVWELEQSEIGITHAELGAYMLGLWGLSDPIVEAVAYHHRPGECIGKTFAPVTAVHVADALLPCLSKYGTDDCTHLIDTTYLEKLHLSDRIPVWKELVRKTEKETTV
jgi:HD-like signal output (HDOD) protein